MSLTGVPLLVGLVSLFVASMVTLVILWRFLAPNRVLPILGRVAGLVVMNVLLLLTAAVGLNDQYLFYADWNDLLGNSATATMDVGHVGGSATDLFIQSDTGTGPAGRSTAVAIPAVFPIPPSPMSLPALPAGAGPANRLLTFHIKGDQSGLSGEVMVLLPTSYFDRRWASHDYPVIIAPPTYPGSPEALFRNFDLKNMMAAEVHKHDVADSILVVPQTSFAGAPDSECVNYPAGLPQVDTWMSKDVPTWVSTHFRAASGRASWATMGVSAGAWCASMLSFRHPDTFSAAISLSGYFFPKFDLSPPYPAQSPSLLAYNLEKQASAAPAPIAMLVQASAQDRVSYPSTARFLKSAKAPLSITSVISPTGGHRWIVWRPLLPVSLKWLGKTVPGFAP